MRTTTLALALATLGGAGGCAATNAGTLPPASVASTNHEEFLSGPDVHLATDRDVLLGRIKGGRYDVAIGADRAKGNGPFGAIDVRLRKVAGGYDVDGLWNGSPISFVVGKTFIRGNSDRVFSSDDRASETCTYDVEKLRNRNVYAGYENCGAFNTPVRFEVQPKGASSMDVREALMTIAYLVAPPAGV